MASEAMLRGLHALDEAEDKKLSLYEFRRSLKITNKGQYLVSSRMLRDRLVAEVSETFPPVITITFKGLQTIKGLAKQPADAQENA